MKKIKFLLFLGFFAIPGSLLWAQNAGLDLANFNQKRLQISKAGMITLGSWALGNMLLGGIMRTRTEGVTQRFHEMNIYWNAVNLGLAGFGLYAALRGQSDLGVLATWQEQAATEKILLFNAGLDVGYILGGLYLTERSRRPEVRQATLKGFGRSLMLQGAFLLVFDVSLYLAHHQHLKNSRPLFENLQLGMMEGGLGMRYQF
ncbi:MAG: hypothetical protein HC913_16210 [Microscillaceae bacterium]|nr:hypothetical protein [Microscillaceae bacterium]